MLFDQHLNLLNFFCSILDLCTGKPERLAHRLFMTMMILGFLFVLIFCLYGVSRLSARSPGHRYGWSLIWRLACLIAVLRISALWVGLAGLRRSDWLQVPANFVLILGLPDIYVVKAARAQPLRWAILGSLTLAVTSFAWSAAVLWVVNRLGSNAAARRDEG
jgi:hypothetical protein